MFAWQRLRSAWVSLQSDQSLHWIPLISHLMTKQTEWHVRSAKTQISLGIRPVWSESLLSAWRKLGSLASHWAHSEDSDQTGWMPRLIWVFVGHTVIMLVMSWGGSYRQRPIFRCLVKRLQGCVVWYKSLLFTCHFEFWLHTASHFLRPLGTYGLPKRWYFPFTKSFWCYGYTEPDTCSLKQLFGMQAEEEIFSPI